MSFGVIRVRLDQLADRALQLSLLRDVDRGVPHDGKTTARPDDPGKLPQRRRVIKPMKRLANEHGQSLGVVKRDSFGRPLDGVGIADMSSHRGYRLDREHARTDLQKLF